MAAPPICDPINEDIAFKTEFENYLFSPAYDSAIVKQGFDSAGRYCIHFHLPPTVGPLTRQLITDRFFILTFYFEKRLGGGTFGTVWKLRSDSPPLNLAVKFSSEKEEDQIASDLETFVSPHFLPGSVGCDLLRVKPSGLIFIVPSAQPYSYFLECASNTLDKLITKYIRAHPHPPPPAPPLVATRNQFVTWANQIRLQMLCLLSLRDNSVFGQSEGGPYVYSDLKPANILYFCRNPVNLNDVQLKIGDLGGAVMNSSGNYASTFPPPEYCVGPPVNPADPAAVFPFLGNIRISFPSAAPPPGVVVAPADIPNVRANAQRNLQAKLKTLSWNLGIILLSFIPNGDTLGRPFVWNFIRQNGGISRADFRAARIALGNFYGAAQRNWLHPDPNTRTDITTNIV